MIFTQRPSSFNPKFEVASCFIECNNEILLLHRQDNKIEGNTWCLPAGKIEENETPLSAAIREIEEETSLAFKKEDLRFIQKVYVRYPDYDFIYHMFCTGIKEKPQIRINPDEHKDFRWITPRDALRMPLIKDEDACINLFYKI